MKDAVERSVDTSFLRLLPSLMEPQSQPFHCVSVYLLKLLVGGYGQIHDALTRGINNENKVYVRDVRYRKKVS
jgi:hypothetical protein